MLAFVSLSLVGNWFVRHDRQWTESKRRTLPAFLCNALVALGEPNADLTDSFGLTGSDATATNSVAPSAGEILFAGLPKAIGVNAPSDVKILDKGHFIVGYSPSLMRPVWCAYRARRESRFPAGKRPYFRKDPSVKACPKASAYSRSGYDRGHMVPNYAIVTRYGAEAQKKTFLMTNIAPQSPSLNRGVWREIEHRAADLFTAKWGDVWIIVGAISGNGRKLKDTRIDIPHSYYQIMVARSGNETRALAFLVPQNVPWKAWPRHYLTSIDTIERLTGYDFLAELDDDTEDILESQTPTRLWPIRFWDAFKAFGIHSRGDG